MSHELGPKVRSEVLFFDDPFDEMTCYRVVKGYREGEVFYIWYVCERAYPGSYAFIHMRRI